MADSAFSLTVSELQNYRASQYVGVAGLVVLLWDHLLTFNDEVRLIWRAPLSIPKLLFLFNRYAVPISLIALTYATSGLSDDTLPDSNFSSAKYGLVSGWYLACCLSAPATSSSSCVYGSSGIAGPDLCFLL
ncbi:hypothetical protein AZE42_04038 [Rhizopogon vesiculosus]|uniref:DUF6533 domain-containing protein n=1 Tax=Rhizopogon vesiculosus TaxID=180088 RepID=A0A1J8Q7L2_9AGAM|nr:hypothetical protein AZE42_04038 [Rhizopogon vesiculosus]